LSKNLPQIKYIKFSRDKESNVTGADWEWHFIDNKHFFTLRIQAKRIKNCNENLYPKILYKPENGILQIEKLIKNAKSINFESFKAIPLYVWYYASKNEKTMCRFPKKNTNSGIFLSSAEKMKEEYVLPAKKYINANELLKHANPMQCLVCCPLSICNSINRNSAELILSYLSKYFHIPKNDFLQPIENLPTYVSHIIQNKPDVEKWLYQEYTDKLKDIKSIVVTDLRDVDFL
jgi:hypothetical protein